MLRVPGTYATIQAAVDAAHPGDLVLIAPGVYHENVKVADMHGRIVLRGLDRNRVVLDGGNRLSDGIAIHADGVAVENLTVRRYLVNGVVWSPSGEYGGRQRLQGWRGSYLTAWCHLREEERVFRMDRITRADPVPSLPRARRPVPEVKVDGHETRLPESVLSNTDIGLSRAAETVEPTRRSGG